MKAHRSQIFLVFLALAVMPAQAAIYRWVDENGQVRFSDRIPPPVAKLERHVLDKQGNLRDVLARQRTLEELEQHRQRLAAIQSEQARRAEQERYDDYLWTTFANLDVLKALRDDRLAERQSQINQALDKLDSLERAIARETQRKSSSAVAQQNLLRALQQDVEHLKIEIDRITALRQQEFDGLNRDMQRYEYLWVQNAMNRGN